jgi:hypothetical protein
MDIPKACSYLSTVLRSTGTQKAIERGGPYLRSHSTQIGKLWKHYKNLFGEPSVDDHE